MLWADCLTRQLIDTANSQVHMLGRPYYHRNGTVLLLDHSCYFHITILHYELSVGSAGQQQTMLVSMVSPDDAFAE